MSSPASTTPASTSAPALVVDDVRKSYGALRALDGVGFTIPRGEFFGLLGPNGAGKSTLISIIAGLARADAGRVGVMGYDTVTDYRSARRSLGVVPQELVFDPFFKVTDMLRLQAGYYGAGPEAWPWIDTLLRKLDLWDKRTTPMRALSGGMKRRVLIAQALVHKPPVVILDEPTAGVDVELRRTLWAFMRELHAAGTTVVLTTHYLEEAQDMCSRIAIIDKGRLRALETTGALIARHPYRFVAVTLAPGERLPAAFQPLVTAERDGRFELKLEQPTHPIGGVLAGLRDAGVTLTDIQTRDASLEDIFVELTGHAAPAPVSPPATAA